MKKLRLSSLLLSLLLFCTIFFTPSIMPAQAMGDDTAGILSAAGNFTLALQKDGSVMAWGQNDKGQLGIGNTTAQLKPVKVNSLTGVSFISTSSNYFSVAATKGGSVYAWGNNDNGQIGKTAGGTYSTPVVVSGLSGVKSVAAGYGHVLALKNDGTVWAWGSNGSGQLGNGKTTNSITPVQVAGLTNVSMISAGAYFSLALTTDGTVWAWGNNYNNQLGNGTTTNSSKPVKVATGMKSISAGWAYSLALSTSGTVYAWGANATAQLGLGTSGTPVSRPAKLALSGIQAISACNTHSMALTTSGLVYVWGDNQYYQMGDGTTTRRQSPVLVPAPTGVIAISCGSWSSFAVQKNGKVFGWGDNEYGQLGNGTKGNVSTKPAVIAYTAQVETIAVTGVALSQTKIALSPLASITLTATISPANATDKTVTWASSNQAVATVSADGVVKAVAEGAATITVKTQNGAKTAACSVTVREGASPAPTSLTLSKTSASLAPKQTLQLTVTALPQGADARVTYSSDNTKVATVSASGLVQGVAAGTARITVKSSKANVSAVCTITIARNDTVYRALLVAEDDYPGTANDLDGGPTNDAVSMLGSFKFSSINGVKYSKIDAYANLSKAAFLNQLKSTFAGAKEGDVSLLYYSGHGSSGNGKHYIVLTDNYFMSADELEGYLRTIPGTVVLIMDSCNSGGFIAKGGEKTTNEDFTKGFLDAFKDKASKALFNQSKYKVITAARGNQVSVQTSFIVNGRRYYYGVMTRTMLNGFGWDYPAGTMKAGLPADANGDKKVSLQEAYAYTSKNVTAAQVTQVWPANDNNFFLFGK